MKDFPTAKQARSLATPSASLLQERLQAKLQEIKPLIIEASTKELHEIILRDEFWGYANHEDKTILYSAVEKYLTEAGYTVTFFGRESKDGKYQRSLYEMYTTISWE